MCQYVSNGFLFFSRNTFDVSTPTACLFSRSLGYIRGTKGTRVYTTVRVLVPAVHRSSICSERSKSPEIWQVIAGRRSTQPKAKQDDSGNPTIQDVCSAAGWLAGWLAWLAVAAAVSCL